MSEFVDTNVLIYVHDASSGRKQRKAVELITRLYETETGVTSTQVLSEFYSVATKKLGRTSQEVEQIILDLEPWPIHCPTHQDIVDAIGLQRRYRINWWDALLVSSAAKMGCSTLWTEDLSHGQRYSGVTVRNPFL